MKLSLSSNKQYPIAVLLVVVFALVLRLVLINQSFWLDEAAQALESFRPLSQQFDITNDFQPPLYHLVIHLLTYFSKQEWWLRLASVIPGLITIVISMHLAKILANRQVAVITGLILATGQFHIFYSQELRPYSLGVMWAVLSMYRLLLFIRAKKPRFDYLYVLFTTLGMYTIYTFPFVLMAQIIYILLFQRHHLKLFTLSLVTIIILCLPWLPQFLKQLNSGLLLVATLPAWGSIVSPAPLKALLLVAPKFIFGRIDLPNTMLFYPPLILALGYYFYLFLKGSHLQPRFLLSWAIVPLLAAGAVSFFIPVLEPKRLLFCLPAIVILIASGIGRSQHVVLHTGVVLSINLLAICLYWITPQYQREPWREVVQRLEARDTNRSVYIFPWTSPYAPFEWYKTSVPHVVTFESLPVTNQGLDPKLTALNEVGPDMIFVFEYLADITDPQHMILSQLNSRGYRRRDTWQYPGIGRIFIYVPDKVMAVKYH